MKKEDEKLNLIFLPSLSTKEDVTDVSGRGVGMDVVKRNIQDLNGSVEVSSEEGIYRSTYKMMIQWILCKLKFRNITSLLYMGLFIIGR